MFTLGLHTNLRSGQRLIYTPSHSPHAQKVAVVVVMVVGSTNPVGMNGGGAGGAEALRTTVPVVRFGMGRFGTLELNIQHPKLYLQKTADE